MLLDKKLFCRSFCVAFCLTLVPPSPAPCLFVECCTEIILWEVS
ncbi:hypothetical protein KP509_10G055200 [Ceratopteris richardii]|uniref:Uncharacterized protein n=1 Tax=Ceratopteris richardii TaxID=49495 RepID=A0A8T2TW29_CERRI|nr:hypothetical protein KP509_10G055200 [Ceratopteris richardii]